MTTAVAAEVIYSTAAQQNYSKKCEVIAIFRIIPFHIIPEEELKICSDMTWSMMMIYIAIFNFCLIPLAVLLKI